MDVVDVATCAVRQEISEPIPVLRMDERSLWAVAGGMDGAAPAVRAAKIAFETIRERADAIAAAAGRAAAEPSTRSRLDLIALLEDTLYLAHAQVTLAGAALGDARVATPLLMAVAVGDRAVLAWIGEARAALVRRGVVRLATRTRSSAETGYESLGLGHVDVGIAEVPVGAGDTLVLATEGLWRALDPEVVAAAADYALAEGARRLVAASRGLPDAWSAVLLRFMGLEVGAGADPIAIVRDLFLFRGLSHPELLAVAPYLEERRYAAGEVVVREGEPGEAFYGVVEGRIRITHGGASLTELGPGAHFGEIALTNESPRTATATSLGASRLVELSREHFEALLYRRPDIGVRIAMALLAAMGGRVVDLSERLARRPESPV